MYKDDFLLNIPEITPIESEAWEKRTSFESLPCNIRGQMVDHNISNLVSVISHETPINVTSIFIHYTQVKEHCVSSMTDVVNLLGTAFIYCGGNAPNKCLPSTNFKDCHTDLVFIKLGYCHLDGKVADNRINQSARYV